MSIAPVSSGLTLPIFDPGVRLFEKYELVSGEQVTTDPHFVREIHVWSRLEAPTDIADLLHKTDEELQLVAAACGALVVEHEWGLMRSTQNPAPKYKLRNITGVPAGYRVVALVDTILETSGVSGTEDVNRITRGIRSYNKQRQGVARVVDIGLKQFMHGVKLADHLAGEPADPSHWYVDIEPTLVI